MHLLLSSHEGTNIEIANATIKSFTSKKLLGVTIDNKLKFDKHVENICQKANKKLNALARLVNYMDLPKRHILMNSFFNAQLNIVLLFECFTVVHLTTKLTGYMSCQNGQNNKRSNLEELLLIKDNSVSIHHQNVQRLAIQMYMVTNGISPDIVS